MGANGRRRRSKLHYYATLATVIVGVILILSSFLLVDKPTAWYASIIIGVLAVLAGFWLAAHPLYTTERRFLALRAEVDRFIDLVRKLNSAATTTGAQEEFEGVKSAMLESVERMAELAGKEDQPPGS